MGYFFNIVFLKSSCTLNLFGELPKIQRSRLHPTYSNLFDLQGILGMVWFLKVPYFSSVQPLSHVWLFVTPWTAARQASLSITNFQSLLKLISIESVMPSSHLILCHPPSPPAFNLSQHQGLFQWGGQSIGVSASASVLPMTIQDWFPLGLKGLSKILFLPWSINHS